MVGRTNVFVTEELSTITKIMVKKSTQGSAKECCLGCVKRAPAVRGSQDAGITQPRDNFLTDPCILETAERDAARRGHPFWGEFRDTRLKSLEGDVELSRELQQSSKMLSCRDEVRAANEGIVHLLNFGTRTLITPNGVASAAAPAARKFSIYSLKIRIHQEMVDGRESHSRLTRKRNEPCVRDVYAPNLTTTVQGFTKGGP